MKLKTFMTTTMTTTHNLLTGALSVMPWSTIYYIYIFLCNLKSFFISILGLFCSWFKGKERDYDHQLGFWPRWRRWWSTVLFLLPHTTSSTSVGQSLFGSLSLSFVLMTVCGAVGVSILLWFSPLYTSLIIFFICFLNLFSLNVMLLEDNCCL